MNKVISESFIAGGFFAFMFLICIVDSLNIYQILASSVVVIGAFVIGLIYQNLE